MKPRVLLILAILLATPSLNACSHGASEMQDGYYTAEANSFNSDGWKEFITIYVSDNKIVTVEYNAKNASGFIMSWDVDYMREMKEQFGTYPNKYSRWYAAELLNKQNTSGVRAITGAGQTHISFKLLAEAAIAQAKAGDKKIAFVDLPNSGESRN